LAEIRPAKEGDAELGAAPAQFPRRRLALRSRRNVGDVAGVDERIGAYFSDELDRAIEYGRGG
jgi:hypothetical protein